MHAGTVLFNGADLSAVGKPRLTIRRQADPPAFPTRQLVTLTVTVALEAGDPGTVQARLRYLQATMATGEGILASQTGSGHGVSWMATPAGDNLGEALSGNTNSLEMSFTAVENHPGAAVEAIASAIYTRAGGTAIHLHAVREPKVDIRTERHSERASARRATIVTRSFKARVAQANAADPAAMRLAYLQAQAEIVKALDAREGLLEFGTESNIVRVQQFSPVIDEGRNALDVEVQCYHVVYPHATKAESAYDIRTRRDEGSGEEVITLSGTIEAATRAIAMGKLEAIRTAETTGTRRVAALETGDRKIDGADTEGIEDSDWPGALTFTLELRAPASGSHYKLRISESRDIRSGMRWNYSGSVTAADESASLAIARGIAAAAGKPVQTKSEETLDLATDLLDPGTRRLVKLDFSYEFEGPADGFIGGELTVDLARPLFGEWRRVASGYLVAATREIAEARMTALLAGEGTALEFTMKWSEVYHDPTGNSATPARVFQKLDFTAASRATRTNAAAKFTDTTAPDPDTMMQTRTVTGSLWTDTEANAETALAGLVTLLFGTAGPQKIVKTHHRERSGSGTSTVTTTSAWVQLDFTMERQEKLAGTPGFDIIDASYTLQRRGSIQQAIITAVPFGMPVAQVNTGKIPGSLVLSARCKARLSSTARAWVQGKRSLVNAIGSEGTTRHETAQPDESAGPEHARYSGTEVTLWNFSGTYQWGFTGTALDGIWPSGQGGVS